MSNLEFPGLNNSRTQETQRTRDGAAGSWQPPDTSRAGDHAFKPDGRIFWLLPKISRKRLLEILVCLNHSLQGILYVPDRLFQRITLSYKLGQDWTGDRIAPLWLWGQDKRYLIDLGHGALSLRASSETEIELPRFHLCLQ